MIQITNIWKVFNTVPSTEYVLTITLAVNYYWLYGFGNNMCWIHSLHKAGEIFIRPILKVMEMGIKRLVQGHTGPSEQESRAAWCYWLLGRDCAAQTHPCWHLSSVAWVRATFLHQQWHSGRDSSSGIFSELPHILPRACQKSCDFRSELRSWYLLLLVKWA